MSFSTLRLAFVGLFVLAESWLLAGRLTLFSERSIWEMWLVLITALAVVGGLMMMSRVLLVILPLMGAGLLFYDSQGWPLWQWGALLWGLGGLSAFIVTLSAYARYIAPPLNQEFNSSSFLGFRLLLTHAFRDINRPKPFRNLTNLPESFNTIGAGFIPSHRAISIFKGIRYITSLGSGYTMLQNNKWYIREWIDVRPQSRSTIVDVTTRDGIFLAKTKFTVRFRIRQPDQPISRMPFPFDSRAIRPLIYGGAVQEQERMSHVYDMVAPAINYHATDQIARYSLDELIEVNNRDIQTLDAIGEYIKTKLEEEFSQKGLQIDSVGIGTITLPESIKKERIKQWKKGWMQPITARGVGTGIRVLDPSVAEMQLEVLHQIAENIETLKQKSLLPMERTVINRLEGLITDAATEGMLHTLIPAPPKEGK